MDFCERWRYWNRLNKSLPSATYDPYMIQGHNVSAVIKIDFNYVFHTFVNNIDFYVDFCNRDNNFYETWCDRHNL